MPAHAAGLDVGVGHEDEAREHAGHDAADEEVADGDLGRDAVDHEGVARGNHDADGAGRCHEGAGKELVVAAFHHGGDGEGADGGHRGGSGAGDGAEEHAGGDRGQRHAAVEAAQHLVGKGEQALGEAACPHEHAGSDEEGDGHDGEAVDGGEGGLGEVLDGQGVGAHDRAEGGQAEGDGDGHAAGAQDEEVAEEHRQGRNVVVEDGEARHVEGEQDRVERRPEQDGEADADQRVLRPADLGLPPEILDKPQAHEAEAYGQDEVGQQEGHAHGRRVLREGQQALDLGPAGNGDDHGQEQETEVDQNPADVLPARGHHVVEYVHADGGALAYGRAEGEVGDPDEDVAGEFLGPHHGAGRGGHARDDVAVRRLQGDEEDDGEYARDEEDLLEILVKPAEQAGWALLRRLARSGGGDGGAVHGWLSLMACCDGARWRFLGGGAELAAVGTASCTVPVCARPVPVLCVAFASPVSAWQDLLAGVTCRPFQCLQAGWGPFASGRNRAVQEGAGWFRPAQADSGGIAWFRTGQFCSMRFMLVQFASGRALPD